MNIDRPISGIQVLLATPMTSEGALDFHSAFALADHVIAGGVDGIILLGSTGEFALLMEAERREFVERMIRHIGGQVPVGVCPGLPGTAATVELARHAEEHGAEYLLVPLPYYFANTLAGAVEFFRSIAESVAIPVMPYDGAGGNAMDLEMWRRIMDETQNVSLAKITVPFPPKIRWLNETFAGRLEAFGGSDQTILLALANGAAGLTVAGANVVPQAFARLWRLYSTGEKDAARRLYYTRISPMNVITVPAHTEFVQCYKQALYWMGIIESPYARPPLTPLDDARKAELLAALEFIEAPLASDRIEYQPQSAA